MKKLQGSFAAKLCAWIILLAAAFGAGVAGTETALDIPDVMADHWQDTARFHNALEDRRRELLEGAETVLQTRALGARIAEGDTGPLAYADLEALQEEAEALEERFSRSNTWFRFRVMNADTRQVLGSNLKDNEAMVKAVRTVYTHTFEVRGDQLFAGYTTSWSDEGYEYTDPPTEVPTDGETPEPVKLVLEYGVPETVTSAVSDEFRAAQRTYEINRLEFQDYLTRFVCLTALSLLAMCFLLWSSGHKKGVAGAVTTWQEKIFFDIYAAAMIFAGVWLVFAAIGVVDMLYYRSAWSFYLTADNTLAYMGMGAICAAFVAVVTLLLRTFAVRLKTGCLVKTTLLCRVVTWTVRTVHDFVRFLPVTWKMVLGFGAYVIFTFWLIMVGRYDGAPMLMYFCLQLVLMLFLAWWAYGYHRLRQGTRTIAGGDLEYQIDTRHMPYDLRLQAEELNNISAGLSTAVDERMKSERFKAELITNVSHDLKTPLTSIINYVNLLKSTQQTDPRAAEYIEVLDRKSQQLKKLTEDLVEASKASTGVLSVTREKIGMSQLIDQAMGEWEEKLAGRRLTLVTALSEGETWVYADGRHLWRVIDNLLSNCAKYAMEGTRVYLDLERGKGQVSLSVKNISRDPLNVPADRLMERFVRGEESRSTEGSGLGLSIARSLTELQGGSFELAVDGDLFKAIVTLPQAN